MPQLNIHWKGYPRYHLPQIRVVSANRPSFPSRSIRSISQHTAEQAFLKAITPVTSERRKSRFKIHFRRRKGRSSKSSSSVVRARRRVSVRARQNIQVFGWDTPLADLASRVTTEKTGTKSSFSPSPKTINLIPEAIDVDPTLTTILTTTDGAGSSVLKRVQAPNNEPQNIYSLMHVAEVPVYWKDSQKRGKPSLNPDRLSIHSGRELEDAHVEFPELVDKKNTYRGLGSLDRSRTYDTRIDPQKRVEKNRRKTTPFVRRRTQASKQRITSELPPRTKLQRGVGSPEFWEAVGAFQLRPKTLGATKASKRSLVESAFAEAQSRSASQKKALSRFTKELELYLQATRALPKQSLVLSPSATTVSANTISELRPYQDEFQAAGLAVTSAEQRRILDLKDISSFSTTPPATPPKDKKFENMAPLRKSTAIEKKVDKRGPPSFASGSTGTTVIGWTPPHEKSYPRQNPNRPPSDISSDNTVVGFTPPHERIISQQPQPVMFQTHKKKSLPWLRRPEPIDEAISPKKSVTTIEPESNGRTTPLKGWVPMSESRNATERAEKKSESVTKPGISQRSTEVRWKDTKYNSEYVTRSTVKSSPTQRKTYATQTDLGSFESADATDYLNIYTDMATQTMDSHVEETSLHPEKSIVERAPVLSGRSRTFPVKSNHGKGECQEPRIEPRVGLSAAKLSRPSTVRWQGIENATQTEDHQPELAVVVKGTRQRKILSFPYVEKVDHRRKTFPVSSGIARGPFQPTSALKISHKSMDESKSPNNDQAKPPEKSRSTSLELEMIPPSRKPPSLPPLCTQCAAPLVQEIPEFEVELDLEPTKYSPQRSGPSHSCTARSSLQCQQCFPFGDASPKTSLPPPLTREVEYEIVDRSRSSTRPIIPVNVNYIREISRWPTWRRDSLSSPEAKTTEKKWVEESIEDYAKYTPVPEPEKRSFMPKLWPKAPPSPTEPINQQPMCSVPVSTSPKTSPEHPQQPIILNTSPPLLSDSFSLSLSSLNSTSQMDKKVFKGLHVATAAACDEDVDKWIEEITGCGVRRFLADLSAFEGLGTNTLAGVAKRAAKQRRDRVRAWEAVREKRILEKVGKEGRKLDRRLGMVASDQSERLRSQEGGHRGGERSERWLKEELALGDLRVEAKERKSDEDMSSEKLRSRGWEEEIEWRLK